MIPATVSLTVLRQLIAIQAAEAQALHDECMRRPGPAVEVAPVTREHLGAALDPQRAAAAASHAA